MIRYVFMGSPPIAANILSFLCEKMYPPVGVVTQEAKPAGRGHKLTPTAVEQLAREKELPVIASKKISVGEDFERLKSFQPDLIFVVAFGQILRECVLALPKHGCLNVHASLLPKYRGAGPVQWALFNGDSTTGISIQKMVKALDAGDVLLQREFPIEATDTTASLWQKMSKVGAEASMEAIQQVEAGQARYTPQDEDKVSQAPKITKEMAEIDWTRGATQIWNQIRAFVPWPIAQTKLGGTRLKIHSAQVVPQNQSEPPGTLLTDHRSYVHVVTGEGALALTEIQLENRKRLQIQDFLKAYQGCFPFKKIG